jgi:hypothetical protein
MKSLAKPVIALVCLGLLACEDVRFIENPVHVDTFQQAPNPTVDILWVVDNSGTMREERQELGAKFDQFMSRLEESGASYHIGVVSTDADDPTHSGRLQGSPLYISNTTPNAKDAFIQNVDLAETANRVEKGLDGMRLALSDELLAGHNTGFLRQNAALFVIVISDEDDGSIGTTRYYARWLDHLKAKGNENLVSLSAIVGTEGCDNVTSFGTTGRWWRPWASRPPVCAASSTSPSSPARTPSGCWPTRKTIRPATAWTTAPSLCYAPPATVARWS